jgi:hypothetical protein
MRDLDPFLFGKICYVFLRGESNMIDKLELLNRLILLIKNDIEKQTASFEYARRASMDAPGRMQSRHDTTGVESAWVADGLAKTLNEKEQHITRLTDFHFSEAGDNVHLGSIVSISTGDSSMLEHYFILPIAGGYKLQIQDVTIVTLTTATPMGKALIGKQIGDVIEMKFPIERTILIEELV